MHWLAHKFELSRQNADHNMQPMEGLRGFAVLLVFIVHYVSLTESWTSGHPSLQGFVSALHTIGNVGVDLFFVLSGYLIYAALMARPQPFGRFMGRRIQRIYPTFLVVFAVYLVLSLLQPTPNRLPAETGPAMLYLLANLLLLPGLVPIEPLITVAWSLSYEMFYYLTLPLLFAAFGLRSRSSAWRVGLFSGISVALAWYCALYAGPVRLAMFIAGILLYEAIRNGWRMPYINSVVALLLLVAGLLNTLLPTVGSAGYVYKVVVLFVSFFVLCGLCFVQPQAWFSRVFTWTPLRWLGNMSYSYYLIHGLVLKVSFMVLAPRLPTASTVWLFWAMLLPFLGLTLLGAAALFLLVERPLSLSPKTAAKHSAGPAIPARQ